MHRQRRRSRPRAALEAAVAAADYGAQALHIAPLDGGAERP